MPRTLLAPALLAPVLLLVGCGSQIDALQPVGGDAMTGVKFAATDVLLDRKFGILEAPVCTQARETVSCVGSLTDGAVINVQADVGTKPHTMTLTVGGVVVYEGEVQAVLDDAARATGEADES
jgi:uncharacterized lipoprotein NlpE involved in copper resistance